MFNNTTGEDYCNLFADHDERKCLAVIVVKRITSCLSVLGGIFILFLIWVFRKYTVFPQRLIAAMATAGLLNSIVYISGDQFDPGARCTTQAWGVMFTSYAILLWMICITFNLFMNAVLQKDTAKYEIVYHVLGWGLPFIMACIPLFGENYGPAGVWCWLKDDWKWRFGFYYLELMTAIFIIMCAYLYIVWTVHRKSTSYTGSRTPEALEHHSRLKKDVKLLLYYPMVFLILSIFPLINRIQNATNSSEDYAIFPLVLLSAICSPSKGVANAIVFGLDRETRNRLTIDQLKCAIKSRFKEDEQIIPYPLEMEGNAEKDDGVSHI